MSDGSDSGGGVEDVERIYREQWDVLKATDEQLEEFVKDHPVFAERFNIDANNSPVEGGDLIPATLPKNGLRLESEWDFATAYGYREGIVDVLAALDEVGISQNSEDNTDA